MIEKRILVINPDINEQKEICNSLKEEGYIVETSHRLFEALYIMRDRHFDCVIMDVNLPDMGGAQAIQVLRELHPHTKIIATTSNNSKMLELTIRAQDVFYYHIKSFGMEELKQAVNALFAHLKKQEEKDRKRCPHLKTVTMTYCNVAPVKKMIPLESVKTPSPCITGKYETCSFYIDSIGGLYLEEIRGFQIKRGLYYTPSHLWLRPELNGIRIGLDDFARKLLGSFTGIELPLRGALLKKGEEAFTLICGGKSVSLLAPFDGRVIDIHESLINDLEPLNTDPYNEGWLMVIHSLTEQPIKGALFGEEARKWLEEDIERLHRVLGTEVGIGLTDGGTLIHNLHSRLNENQWNHIINLFFKRRG